MLLTAVGMLAAAGGKARIESDEGVRGKLANIMAYHAVK
jgi:hypothetical protein